MRDLFEVAAGSTTGKDHRRLFKNGHDAYVLYRDEDLLIGIVCDGCGSGEHSEIGAKMGARLIATAIQKHYRNTLKSSPRSDDPDMRFGPYPFWDEVRRDVLVTIWNVATQMGGHLPEVVNDYFLFTTVGAFITPHSSYFFSNGDGIIIVNGGILELGPFPNNEPPYFAYSLIRSSLNLQHPELLGFIENVVLPTEKLQSFLIGTDGVSELLRSSDKIPPGKKETAGPISQFWEQDRYFSNPDNIRRRLNGMNHEMVRYDAEQEMLVREYGLLSDDTTLIVGRRKE